VGKGCFAVIPKWRKFPSSNRDCNGLWRTMKGFRYVTQRIIKMYRIRVFHLGQSYYEGFSGRLEAGGQLPTDTSRVCWTGQSLLMVYPWQEGLQAVAVALLGHSCFVFIPFCIGRLWGGTEFLNTYCKTLFIQRIHTSFIPSLFIAFCLVSPQIQGIHKAVKGG